MKDNSILITLNHKDIKSLEKNAHIDIDKNGTTFKLTPEISSFPIPSFGDNNSKQVDPPIPFKKDQLIQKLKNDHKITFTNKEEQLAEHYFHIAGYRTLVHFTEQLETNITFTELVDIYEIDLFLKRSISSFVLRIETSLKNYLSQEILNKSNSDAFCFENTKSEVWKRGDTNSKNKKIQVKIKKWIGTSVDEITDLYSNNSSLKKMLEKYNGHLPIWVLLENLMFGRIIIMLDLLDKDIVFDCTSKIMTATPTEYSSNFKTLRILRNATAHNVNLLGTKFNYQMKLDSKLSEVKKLQSQLSTDKIEISKSYIFMGLLVMKFCYCKMSTFEKNSWNAFIGKLDKKFKDNKILKNPATLENKYFFPKEWKKLLLI